MAVAAAEAATETASHRVRGVENAAENSVAEEARRAENLDADMVDAQDTAQRAEISGTAEAAADRDAIMVQAMEDELHALEAELGSAGPQPSQHHEQSATDFGVAVSEQNMPAPAGDETQHLLDDVEGGNDLAKRPRIS